MLVEFEAMLHVLSGGELVINRPTAPAPTV